MDLVEPDDYLHTPKKNAGPHAINHGGNAVSLRGLTNLGCLIILCFGILALLYACSLYHFDY